MEGLDSEEDMDDEILENMEAFEDLLGIKCMSLKLS